MNEVNCSESDVAKRSVFDQVVMRLRRYRLERNRIRIIENIEWWHDFEKFKCNDFFVGEVLAERNRKRYDKEITIQYSQLEAVDGELKDV